MRVADLTDDDIGHVFWVLGTAACGWTRLTFEGLTRQPTQTAADNDARHGGPPFWVVLKASPQPGLMHFRTPSGESFTGLLVRASADIYPVEVLFAVSADGRILEIGETAA